MAKKCKIFFLLILVNLFTISNVIAFNGVCAHDKLPNATTGISGDAFSLCFLKNNGNVNCNGDDMYAGGDAVSVSTGLYHACFLNSKGNVICYGDNSRGQSNNYTGKDAVGVAVGGVFTCVLKKNGNVDCYGDILPGFIPAPDYNKGDAVGVAGSGTFSSRAHICVLTSGGNVECFGKDFQSEIENGWAEGFQDDPANNYTGGDAVGVAAGFGNICVLKNNGNVDCFGENWLDAFYYTGHSKDYLGGDAVGVSTGYAHTCILKKNGNVDCYGDNRQGESKDYLGGDAVGVAAGFQNTCVLKKNGNVDCYGKNAVDYGGGDATCFPLGAQGIDVSHNQGTINWKKVAEAGYFFAFVKATEGGTPPPIFIDSNFSRNMVNGRAAGLSMGAYHFARPDTKVGDAKDEALFFLNNSGKYIDNGYLRPALDLEANSGLTKAQLTAWVNTWMNTIISKTGIKPLLYVSPAFAQANLDASVAQYDLWIAHYTNKLKPDITYWTDWVFWQFTETGQVPGIVGNVDLNRFNRLSQLSMFTIQNNIDSDNDCLFNHLDPAPLDADTDDDGLTDGNCGSEDLNSNGIVDPGETDPTHFYTDADGISDGVEKGLAQPESTTDTNMVVFIPDADPFTKTDPTKFDTDADGISDGEEDANHNGAVDPGESSPIQKDTDGDTIIDSRDNCLSIANPDQKDTNNNGIGDACDIKEQFIRGDSNNDGVVDISDAINTLGTLFTGAGNINCKDAADSNDDGELDISDAINTLGFLFTSGGKIPQPFPNIGVDPTPETPELGCIFYPQDAGGGGGSVETVKEALNETKNNNTMPNETKSFIINYLESLPKGTISLTTSPSLAYIYLDGTYKGYTPRNITNMTAGNYQLKLTKYGYYDYKTITNIQSGKTTTMSITLQPSPNPSPY